MPEVMSVDECKAHIKEIVRDHGADASSWVRSRLERATETLATELYTEPGHFLFELIQNADDNTYSDGVQPQVLLAYQPDGTFLFGCNEVGFSKANVNAICDLQQSTKTFLKGGEKSCIGEKGLGFKAVFKVAKKVWINSNNYSFMFDKDQSLGMIDPIWSEDSPFSSGSSSFPEALKMTTMIAFKIEESRDLQRVVEQLEDLEPRSLMFLQRLAKVKVVRLSNTGEIVDQTILSCKQDIAGDLTQFTTEKVHGNQCQTSRYVISKSIASDMPETEKRPGVTRSSIQLAFPYDWTAPSDLVTQKIYAYLPIRDSGLRFLVHADFILVASREGIDESQEWNQHLQTRLSHAMVEAFKRLSKTKYRFAWTRYLPEGRVDLNFLNRAIDEFYDLARDEKILVSSAGERSGELSTPNSMMVVPVRFKDAQGIPLLKHPKDQYLSTKYNVQLVSKLVKKQLDGTEFMEMFKDFVSSATSEFREKPASWHSQICSILLAESSRRIDMMPILLLPILPLMDGSWIAMRNPRRPSRYSSRPPRVHFYLPLSETKIALPQGISMSIVEPEAAKDAHRRKFYDQFGAQNLNYEEVLTCILDQHKELTTNMGTEVLVSHAEYVFDMPSMSTFRKDLSHSFWLVDIQDKLIRGPETYMDMPKSTTSVKPVSAYFSKDPSRIRMIHPRYLELYREDVQKQTRWIEWLRSRLGVHVVPRLVNKSGDKLSDEFFWLTQQVTSLEWLKCLKDSWGTYQIHMKMVQKQLGEATVRCTDGTTAMLMDTLLPSLKPHLELIPTTKFKFLSLHDTDSKDWEKFSVLGVTTGQDIAFSIKILIYHSQSSARTDEAAISQLYKAIEKFCEHDMTSRVTAKEAFTKHNLIYTSGGWRGWSNCVWEGPRCLRIVHSIASEYSPLRLFFKTHLGLPDASTAHFISQLIAYDNAYDDILEIKEVLLQLSARLPVGPNHDIERLKDRKIFPTMDRRGVYVLLAANDLWFIADGLNLKNSFNGVINLLDYDLNEQEILKPLLELVVPVSKRRLSQIVQEQQIVVGKEKAVQDREKTESLQGKAHYLRCLMDGEQSYILERIEVLVVEDIKLRRYILINNVPVWGADMSSGAMLDDSMRLFVSAKELQDADMDNYEIAEQLQAKFKFQKGIENTLISYILDCNVDKRIESMLEKKCINFQKPSQRLTSETQTLSPLTPNEQEEIHYPTMGVDMATFSTNARSSSVDKSSTTLQTDLSSLTRPSSQEYSTAKFDHDYLKPSNKRSFSTAAITGSENDKRVAKYGGSSSTGAPQHLSIFKNNTSSSSMPVGDLNRIADTQVSQTGFSSRRQTRWFNYEGNDTVSRSEEAFDETAALEIGEQGEKKMYDFLKEHFGEHFQDDMWTSHIRTRFIGLAFDEDDSKMADFTIPGARVPFAEWLVHRGVEQAEAWKGKEVMYHLEVKSTRGSLDEPFHISQNQRDMASKYQIDAHGVPKHVYIVMRVFQLAGNGGDAQVHPYVDPCTLFEEGALTLISPGGYLVFSDHGEEC